MGVRTIAGVLSMLVVCVATASASPDPYRDQADSKVPCPSAPAGWLTPSEKLGTRSVLTPFTPVASALDPTADFGAPIVQVNCDYRTSGGKQVQVSVRYALPIDLNPWNDFDIGCTSTHRPDSVATAAKSWSTNDRIYRIIGAKTWSLATFDDALGQLAASDLPRFEALTKKMFEAAQPLAHNCSLSGNGAPVGVTSTWIFDFNARTTSGGVTSSGRTTGSFATTAGRASGTGAITRLHVQNFRLDLSGNGPARWLALHVVAPIDFVQGHGSELRARLVVIASGDASCGKGSTGTLDVSLQELTPAQVSVRICGQTYLNGHGNVSAQMKTV